MKASGSPARRLLAAPDPSRPAWLLFGADPMQVAIARADLIAALIGPAGPDEMRLTRIAGADLRRDPALLSDALRAPSFFPGPRVAFVEDATDSLAPVLAAALAEWRPGDAAIVVTAGELKAAAALRKPFEAHATAVAIGFYDDPPDDAEIDALLAAEGLDRIGRAARGMIGGLARDLSPGDFRQTLAKLALYKRGDTDPVTPEDVEAVAPLSTEAGIDALLDAVADGREGAVAHLLRRIEAQGVTPVTLCIGATRRFRQLHAAASAPGGPSEGLAAARPPIPWKLRDTALRHVRTWGRDRLEEALRHLIETDLTLRSASRAPGMALMERTLLRLARTAALAGRG